MSRIEFNDLSEAYKYLYGEVPWRKDTLVNENATQPKSQPQTINSNNNHTINPPPSPISRPRPVLPWNDKYNDFKKILRYQYLWQCMPAREFQRFNFWFYKLYLMNCERKSVLGVKNDWMDSPLKQHLEKGTIYELYYYLYYQAIERQMRLTLNSSFNSLLNAVNRTPKFINVYPTHINQFEKYEFINLSFGDFILQYNPETSDLMIFDSSMMLYTDVCNLKEIYEENITRFIYRSQKGELKGSKLQYDEFEFKINRWDLIDLKIKGNYIFLIHPTCVTIVKISLDSFNPMNYSNLHSTGSNPYKLTSIWNLYNSMASPHIIDSNEKIITFKIKLEVVKTIPSPLFQDKVDQTLKDIQLSIIGKTNDNTQSTTTNQNFSNSDSFIHISDVEFERRERKVTLFHSNGTIIQVELGYNLIGQRTKYILNDYGFKPNDNIDEFYEPQYGRFFKLDKDSNKVLIYSGSENGFIAIDLKTGKTNKKLLELKPIKIGNKKFDMVSDIAIEENNKFEYSKIALKYEDKDKGLTTIVIVEVDIKKLREGFKSYKEIQVPVPKLLPNVEFGNSNTIKPVSFITPVPPSFFKIYEGNLYNFTMFKRFNKMNIWSLKKEKPELIKSWTLYMKPSKGNYETCELFSYNFGADMIAFMFTDVRSAEIVTHKQRFEVYRLSNGDRLGEFKIKNSIEFKCIRRIGLTKERIYLHTSTNYQSHRFLDIHYGSLNPGNSILKVFDFGISALEAMMGKQGIKKRVDGQSLTGKRKEKQTSSGPKLDFYYKPKYQ